MKIQLKRSNVLESGAAKQPTPEQMEYGELAVNYNTSDPSIFLKDSTDSIVKVGGDLSLYLTESNADGLYLSKVSDDTAAGAITFDKLTTHKTGIKVTGGGQNGVFNGLRSTTGTNNIRLVSNQTDIFIGEVEVINSNVSNVHFALGQDPTSGSLSANNQYGIRLFGTSGTGPGTQVNYNGTQSRTQGSPSAKLQAFDISIFGNDRTSPYTTDFIGGVVVNNVTPGANQTVNTFAAFSNDANTGFLEPASTNYGYYSKINNSSTGKTNYNFYAAGDAPNYFQGITEHALGVKVTGGSTATSKPGGIYYNSTNDFLALTARNYDASNTPAADSDNSVVLIRVSRKRDYNDNLIRTGGNLQISSEDGQVELNSTSRTNIKSAGLIALAANGGNISLSASNLIAFGGTCQASNLQLHQQTVAAPFNDQNVAYSYYYCKIEDTVFNESDTSTWLDTYNVFNIGFNYTTDGSKNPNIKTKAGIRIGGTTGRNTWSGTGDANNYGVISQLTETPGVSNYNFYAEGNSPNFFQGDTYIGGNTTRNTRGLWESTLTEEQKEQLEAGTLAVPANVATPGDGEFARQWWYEQQSAEDQALIDAGELDYPEPLQAASFTDTFVLGDNTKINLRSDGRGEFTNISGLQNGMLRCASFENGFLLATATNGGGGARSYLRFGKGPNGNKAAIGFINTASNGRGDLVFYTSNVSSGDNFTDDDERMIITRDGRIGVGGGVVPQSQMHIRSQAAAGALILENPGDNSAGRVAPIDFYFEGNPGPRISAQRASGAADNTISELKFQTGNGGNQNLNLALRSDLSAEFFGNVKAPSVQLDSGTIEDYEEGTWTPKLQGSGTAGSPSYNTSNTKGTYAKVGKVVTCQGYIQLTDLGGMAGTIRIHDLPFKSSGQEAQSRGVVNFSQVSSCSDAPVTGMVLNNQTYANLMKRNHTTGNTSNLSETDLTNTSAIRFSMTYITA